MRVMIVDDEPLMRQGIAKKIELSGLPLETVAEAGDGRSALSRLKEAKPEIVITDIRMPGMDGLSFLQQAKQLNEEIEFIIISGYGEFEYAKKAIQYGVEDYLLKPVNKQELKDCLMRILAKLERKDRQSSRNQKLEYLQQEGNEAIRRRVLTKFIQQGDEAEAAMQDIKLKAMQEHCQQFLAIIFTPDHLELPYRSFFKGDDSLVWFAVKNIISTVMESSTREGALFNNAADENELIYILGEHRSVSCNQLFEELQKILESFKLYLKLDFTIGCGGVVDRMELIQQSYRQARQACRNKIIHGSNRVYQATEQVVEAHQASMLSEGDQQLLSHCLNECNRAALHRWIEQRVTQIAKAEDSAFSHLESFCIDFHLLLRKFFFSRTNIPGWIIGEMNDLLAWLQGVSDWRDVWGYLNTVIDNMIEHLSQERHASEYRVIDEVKSYIDSSLHEQINLLAIAERFYFHPNYLARRFKECFGETFINYLTNSRMRKAELLLREPHLQIQQVAELVGFLDAAYFSSVFRKKTGMTPTEYRHRAASM
ncbi:response regulator [Paenibacillus sp. HB172176]|uniref:response regulator n=1 Tax=Paenibacillus sp. HB172176 TaxID=2493690 RepID=UPI00143A46B5|nr:response regulator [Paenibacillus sp. HB172176]